MTISYAILIVIFPCFLTYFYPTGHDVPEEVWWPLLIFSIISMAFAVCIPKKIQWNRKWTMGYKTYHLIWSNSSRTTQKNIYNLWIYTFFQDFPHSPHGFFWGFKKDIHYRLSDRRASLYRASINCTVTFILLIYYLSFQKERAFILVICSRTSSTPYNKNDPPFLQYPHV